VRASLYVPTHSLSLQLPARDVNIAETTPYFSSTQSCVFFAQMLHCWIQKQILCTLLIKVLHLHIHTQLGHYILLTMHTDAEMKHGQGFCCSFFISTEREGINYDIQWGFIYCSLLEYISLIAIIWRPTNAARFAEQTEKWFRWTFFCNHMTTI